MQRNNQKRKILFVCVENSARSQMAEAFFNRVSKNATAISAGTKPATSVNPTAVLVMKEIGIDISDAKPKMLTFEMMDSSDRVITMGCMGNAVCPATMAPTEDWGIYDPAGKPIEKFREIRDVIGKKVEQLVQNLEKSI